MILKKNKSDIEILKESGRVLGSILGTLEKNAKKGVALSELDTLARTMAKKAGAVPTFLGYQPDGALRPYPAALCASLNDVVVHGVPTKRALVDGDVLKIDMGITYGGMITDAARTVIIGSVSKSVRNLVSATRKALDSALHTVKAGRHLGDIGCAIEREARRANVFVLRDLTGHGVGYELHEDPIVFNFGKKGTGPLLQEGMVLAIEPMFSLSCERIVQNGDESYSSEDGSITAHFEDTVVITKKGGIVLT